MGFRNQGRIGGDSAVQYMNERGRRNLEMGLLASQGAFDVMIVLQQIVA